MGFTSFSARCAEDVRTFLAAGMQATPEMREVQFPMGDRLAVIPVELVQAASKVVLVAACFFLLAGLGRDGYSASRAMDAGLFSAALFLLVCLASLTLTPLLLPWLPGRAFAVKGAWLGVGLLVALMGYTWHCLVCSRTGLSLVLGVSSFRRLPASRPSTSQVAPRSLRCRGPGGRCVLPCRSKLPSPGWGSCYGWSGDSSNG